MRRKSLASAAFLGVAMILASLTSEADAKKKMSPWLVAVGEVTSVQADQKTFEVKDASGQTLRFKVTSATEFERECERPKFTWWGDFSDVQQGRWVRVKYYGSTEIKVAMDVDVFLQ